MSPGFWAAYRELLPEFERRTGILVTTASGQSVGNNPNAIAAQLRRGVSADVVILSREGLTELVADGKIVVGCQDRGFPEKDDLGGPEGARGWERENPEARHDLYLQLEPTARGQHLPHLSCSVSRKDQATGRLSGPMKDAASLGSAQSRSRF
jgi:hypothetical protein